jgi:hypothetical protein
MILLCCLFNVRAFAQSATLNEVHTVAAPTVAAPAEHSFTVDDTHAGVLTVTLSDPGAHLTPATPLGSVTLEITSGSDPVMLTTPGGGSGKSLNATGSATLTAAAGTYVIHVVGTPGSTGGSGLTDVQITDSHSALLQEFSDTLATPAGAIPSSQGVLIDSFTVPASGDYTVTLTDMQLPQALPIVTLAIVPQTVPFAQTPLVTLTLNSQSTANTTATLQAGTHYQIFAVGAASSGLTSGGLYGVNVAATGGGASAYSQTIPVGAVTLIKTLTPPQDLPVATYTLSVADLQFPGALTSSGAVVAQSGLPVASQSGAGSAPAFTTNVSAPYQIFGVGLPGSAGGAYSIKLQSSGAGAAAALSVSRAVAPADGSASIYSYDTSLVSEPYTLLLTDFAVPAQFTSLKAAIVQDGAIVGTPLSAPGSTTLNATQGPASLLVYAQAPTDGALFGLDLTATGAGAPLFATSQGVGQAFTGRMITVSQGGNYTATVADLGFPALFGRLWVVVTRGATNVGSIVTAGSFKFDATGGNYFINFIAQPTGASKAGTYAINVAPTPAAPTLHLTAGAPTVPSGTAVTLNWTSQNATACNASGGWSGGKPLQGPATSGLLTTSTTFTLVCTGPGGSDTESVVVGISAPTSGGSSGGGGGGSLAVIDLLALLVGVALCLSVRCARAWTAANRHSSV